MKKKTIKVQLTLPEEVMNRVDKEIARSFSTRSGWFLKIALEELKRIERNVKKVIDLDI
jgi:metal-responsive CopG/Arc/MetJ family transcriptional regulator